MLPNRMRHPMPNPAPSRPPEPSGPLKQWVQVIPPNIQKDSHILHDIFMPATSDQEARLTAEYIESGYRDPVRYQKESLSLKGHFLQRSQDLDEMRSKVSNDIQRMTWFLSSKMRTATVDVYKRPESKTMAENMREKWLETFALPGTRVNTLDTIPYFKTDQLLKSLNDYAIPLTKALWLVKAVFLGRDSSQITALKDEWTESLLVMIKSQCTILYASQAQSGQNSHQSLKGSNLSGNQISNQQSSQKPALNASNVSKTGSNMTTLKDGSTVNPIISLPIANSDLQSNKPKSSLNQSFSLSSSTTIVEFPPPPRLLSDLTESQAAAKKKIKHLLKLLIWTYREGIVPLDKVCEVCSINILNPASSSENILSQVQNSCVFLSIIFQFLPDVAFNLPSLERLRNVIKNLFDYFNAPSKRNIMLWLPAEKRLSQLFLATLQVMVAYLPEFIEVHQLEYLILHTDPTTNRGYGDIVPNSPSSRSFMPSTFSTTSSSKKTNQMITYPTTTTYFNALKSIRTKIRDAKWNLKLHGAIHRYVSMILHSQIGIEQFKSHIPKSLIMFNSISYNAIGHGVSNSTSKSTVSSSNSSMSTGNSSQSTSSSHELPKTKLFWSKTSLHVGMLEMLDEWTQKLNTPELFGSLFVDARLASLYHRNHIGINQNSNISNSSSKVTPKTPNSPQTPSTPGHALNLLLLSELDSTSAQFYTASSFSNISSIPSLFLSSCIKEIDQEKVRLLSRWALTDKRVGEFRIFLLSSLFHHYMSIHPHTQHTLQEYLVSAIEEIQNSNNLHQIALTIGELIRLQVFSHDKYLRNLISTGVLHKNRTDERSKFHKKLVMNISLPNSALHDLNQRRMTLLQHMDNDLRQEDSMIQLGQQWIQLLIWPSPALSNISTIPSSISNPASRQESQSSQIPSTMDSDSTSAYGDFGSMQLDVNESHQNGYTRTTSMNNSNDILLKINNSETNSTYSDFLNNWVNDSSCSPFVKFSVAQFCISICKFLITNYILLPNSKTPLVQFLSPQSRGHSMQSGMDWNLSSDSFNSPSPKTPGLSNISNKSSTFLNISTASIEREYSNPNSQPNSQNGTSSQQGSPSSANSIVHHAIQVTLRYLIDSNDHRSMMELLNWICEQTNQTFLNVSISALRLISSFVYPMIWKFKLVFFAMSKSTMQIFDHLLALAEKSSNTSQFISFNNNSSIQFDPSSQQSQSSIQNHSSIDILIPPSVFLKEVLEEWKAIPAIVSWKKIHQSRIDSLGSLSLVSSNVLQQNPDLKPFETEFEQKSIQLLEIMKKEANSLSLTHDDLESNSKSLFSNHLIMDQLHSITAIIQATFAKKTGFNASTLLNSLSHIISNALVKNSTVSIIESMKSLETTQLAVEWFHLLVQACFNSYTFFVHKLAALVCEEIISKQTYFFSHPQFTFTWFAIMARLLLIKKTARSGFKTKDQKGLNLYSISHFASVFRFSYLFYNVNNIQQKDYPPTSASRGIEILSYIRNSLYELPHDQIYSLLQSLLSMNSSQSKDQPQPQSQHIDSDSPLGLLHFFEALHLDCEYYKSMVGEFLSQNNTSGGGNTSFASPKSIVENMESIVSGILKCTNMWTVSINWVFLQLILNATLSSPPSSVNETEGTESNTSSPANSPFQAFSNILIDYLTSASCKSTMLLDSSTGNEQISLVENVESIKCLVARLASDVKHSFMSCLFSSLDSASRNLKSSYHLSQHFVQLLKKQRLQDAMDVDPRALSSFTDTPIAIMEFAPSCVMEQRLVDLIFTCTASCLYEQLSFNPETLLEGHIQYFESTLDSKLLIDATCWSSIRNQMFLRLSAVRWLIPVDATSSDSQTPAPHQPGASSSSSTTASIRTNPSPSSVSSTIAVSPQMTTLMEKLIRCLLRMLAIPALQSCTFDGRDLWRLMLHVFSSLKQFQAPTSVRRQIGEIYQSLLIPPHLRLRLERVVQSSSRKDRPNFVINSTKMVLPKGMDAARQLEGQPEIQLMNAMGAKRIARRPELNYAKGILTSQKNASSSSNKSSSSVSRSSGVVSGSGAPSVQHRNPNVSTSLPPPSPNNRIKRTLDHPDPPLQRVPPKPL